MFRISEPGIYRDVSEADYRADPAPEPSLTQSLCKVLLEKSPLHALIEHPRLSPPAGEDDEVEKYVKALAIGNAAHKLMLGRGKEIAVIDVDAFRSNEAKKQRDAAIQFGMVPILKKHMDAADAIAASARDQLARHEDRDAFTKGSGEVMIAWQEHGFWYRALVDWLSDDLRTVDDFKTTGMSVAPHVLGIRAESAGWHVQAAFIERGLDILDPAGAGRRRFRFIAQEQFVPYQLVVMHMDEHWMTMGRKKLAYAETVWKICLTRGQWPGYPPRGIVPDYPGWAETRWLEREVAESEAEHVQSLMGG